MPTPTMTNSVVIGFTKTSTFLSLLLLLTLLVCRSKSDVVSPESDVPVVVVEKMEIVVEGRDNMVLDLTQPLEEVKKTVFTLKEGAFFRIQLTFRVNHQIVSGLRYHHVIKRKRINVDKVSYMVGSYPPKDEAHVYPGVMDEAPKGMMARGSYRVKSKFLDDDKNVHLSWEWGFDIRKEWNK